MIVRDEPGKCDKEEKIYIQENLSKTGQFSGRKKKTGYRRIQENREKLRYPVHKYPEYSIKWEWTKILTTSHYYINRQHCCKYEE
jgi:hypothetical protein